MINQLRICEIFEHNKAAFHARFRDHKLRIMAKYDFRIVAMWEVRTVSEVEFVYLLSWKDEMEMHDTWDRFLADEEWIEIQRTTREQNGLLVGSIATRVLRATDYSHPLETSR